MEGGQNPNKINPLFKDVKEYNKYLLSLIGIFVLLLSGIISYNYTNTSYAKWSSSIESKNILKLYVKTGKSALEFAKENVGTGGLEKITHEIDNTLQVDNKFATEYRYRGGNSVVKNYVIFNNEVWRIIGIIPTEDTNGNVENRFKIIKNTSIGDKYWNETEDTTTGTYNNWVTATLNTYLNNDYYSALNSIAKSMVGTTKYYLGGYSSSIITTGAMWQYERKKANDSLGTYYRNTNPIMQNDASKKIALMYASDYGYGASKYCTKNLFNYNGSTSCKTTNNWLDKSEYTWLLSHRSDGSGSVLSVSNDSSVGNTGVRGGTDPVYPVLTLSSEVKISSGSGTSSDPYKLSL